MPPIITCVAALNPCFNVHGVELLIESISMDLEFFDDSFSTKAKYGSTTLWKKANESMFLVLSRIAMDIISVQATLVASKSVFSTSGRVLSIQTTRLTAESLEMCMCLKDHLDAKEGKQHQFGLENPIDIEEEILDADVQQNKAIPLSEEEIELDVASSKGTMSGSGLKGEEVDNDMTNYGYDDYE
nr:zinc finger BED domain-containing protein RICESLEEPER 2-like [Tanacetum cinerariifolium]